MLEDSSSDRYVADREPQGPRIWLLIISIISTVVIFYVAQVVAALAIGIFPLMQQWSKAHTNDWLANSTAAQFMYGLLADGLIVLGIYLMIKLLHWQWSTIGLKKPKLKHIGAGLLASVPYYALYIFAISVVSVLVPSFNINQKQEIGFNAVNGFVPLIMAFAGLVIVPPLAEEIATRGFLYTGLRRTPIPKVAAALIVSLMFGLAHLAEGGAAGPLWVGAIDTFTLSLVLVFLREMTGNLWAGITLHAVKNGVAFLSLFILHVR